MNLFALTFALLLVFLIALSIRRPAAGAIAFIALVPFYYVIRGLAGQSPFAFLWPYMYVAAYVHVLGVRALRERFGPPVAPARWRSPWSLLWAGYALLVLACAWWSPWIGAMFTAPIAEGVRGFNDHRMLTFAGLAVLLMGGPAATIAWRTRTLCHWSWLDWSIAAILGYGAVHVAIGFVQTGHAFYVLESFRYYFVMFGVYFVVRFGLQRESDASATAAIIAGLALVASVEFITEQFLFNSGVSPLDLPWLRTFDALFSGYGRPIPTDGFWVMSSVRDSVFIPYSGVRAIGLFLHPHTLGLFALIGCTFLIPLMFDVRRRGMSPLVVIPLYAVIVTLARVPFLLAVAVLSAVPVATAAVLGRYFAWTRVPLYVVIVAATVWAGSTYAPGGATPHFTWGWYSRPFYTTARAAFGDLFAWAPVELGATVGNVLGSSDDELTVAGAADALIGSVRLLVQIPPSELLFGAGFSPLTRYVVDFFPEAARFRHVQSTADLPYLEYLQQFGLVGLGLLWAHFMLFAVAAARLALKARVTSAWVPLGSCCAVILTAVSLLHLYPLFRMGVNTTYYAIIGIIGFLHARDAAATAATKQTAESSIV